MGLFVEELIPSKKGNRKIINTSYKYYSPGENFISKIIFKHEGSARYHSVVKPTSDVTLIARDL